MNIVLRQCEVEGRLVDVLVERGVISAMGADLPTPDGAVVLDGRGGALIPGLHDHHIHLLALAAAEQSVRVGPPDVGTQPQFVRALRRTAGTRTSGEWVRAVAYHERVAGPLDRWVLDEILPTTPVRVQHRSGALWIVNSAGLRLLDLSEATSLPTGCEVTADGTPNGRLFRLDRWLRGRLGPAEPPDLSGIGRLLLARGVTGLTDATPVQDALPLHALALARRSGALPQEVTVTGAPDLHLATVPPELLIGPAKILLPDHEPPLLDELIESIRTARRMDRAVAIHCVTRVAAVLAVVALDEVGARAGDRIEHGAVLPPDLYAALARLGVTVITQPNLVAERGDDYLAEVDPDDLPHLWPCASLLAAGVKVAAGSDAPFGGPDPWRLVQAATSRRTASGRVLGPHERLESGPALGLVLGSADNPARPRRLEAGGRADLCLLATPLRDAMAEPADVTVRAVMIGSDVHLVDGDDPGGETRLGG